MNLIILLTFLMFLFYYLASFNTLKLDHQWFLLIFFFICSFILRLVIDPNINKDYYAYYNLYNYTSPDNFISFLLSEPYLFMIYKFFSFFTSDKVATFKCIYWFNFLISNLFFIWLATRKDILIWKKIVLFVFYYFLFGFVLLRNTPVYIIYACFFYYSYRNKKFNKILLTPFIHFSGLSLLVLVFQKNKYYLRIFFSSILILLPLVIYYIMPILSSIGSTKDLLLKLETYQLSVKNSSIFHSIHVVFVTLTILTSIFFYKKKALNPIFITTFFIYYISYFINPVLGFRFSPYVFFAIFLFNFNGNHNSTAERNISLASLLLFPYLVSTLLSTHTF